MANPHGNNLTWQEGKVDRSRRRKLLGHGGATVWFTGLSGSGKTTIAVAVEVALVERGVLAYRLDGDNVRHGLCGDLGFSAADRTENVRRAGAAALLFADAGAIALASFISPYVAGRDGVAEIHRAAGLPFYEVHVDCPLEVAEGRDPKGLYKRARAGEIKSFTGIDAPYEQPTGAALRLATDEMDVDDEVAAVLEMLVADGLIGGIGGAG